MKELMKKYGDVVIIGVIALVALIGIPLATHSISVTVEYGIADQVEQVRGAVVHIEKAGAWEASGCVISDDGIIMTARHAVEDGGPFQVTLDNGQVYETSLAIIDKKHDIGFLRIDPSKPLKAAKLANVANVRVGEGVFVMGSPRGKVNFNSVSLGILSASHRNLEHIAKPWIVVFQYDALALPGNSGGPVFNMDGEVIGIHVGGNQTEYAVPVAVLMDSVEVIRSWFELSRFEVIEEKILYSNDRNMLHSFEK